MCIYLHIYLGSRVIHCNKFPRNSQSACARKWLAHCHSEKGKTRVTSHTWMHVTRTNHMNESRQSAEHLCPRMICTLHLCTNTYGIMCVCVLWVYACLHVRVCVFACVCVLCVNVCVTATLQPFIYICWVIWLGVCACARNCRLQLWKNGIVKKSHITQHKNSARLNETLQVII